jgi:hypothetical protein
VKLFFSLWLTLAGATCPATALPPIQTVFIILMENKNWSDIKGSTNAPYINSLLPMASYCEQYYNPPGLHPSLPNYLWLEAGTNFGIYDNYPPATNHQSTTNHLVTLLKNAGISWKTYQEDIDGTYVPLLSTNDYAARHNPFVYFDDVTGTNDPNHAYGIMHIRPYTEFATDLASNTVARYNFLKPNLCHDMHDACLPATNAIRAGDDWLANEVPKILASQAYQNGGALFITFDEGWPGDGPIAMIVLSPFARGGGYFNSIYYTHSSMLRTLQEIFGVGPLLGDAANATNLSDLFCSFGFSRVVKLSGGELELTATGVVPNRPNVVEVSTNLIDWVALSTNTVSTNTFAFTNSVGNEASRFYRLLERR